MADQELIEHAIMELIGARDIDGYILTRVDCKVVDKISSGENPQTAALYYLNGRLYIRVCRDWFKSLTDTQRTAVMKHEVGHFVLKHMSRRNGRDDTLWNVSCLPPDSLIHARQGLVAIQKVKQGQKILTSIGAYSKVTNTIRHQYQGKKMYTIKGMGLLPIQSTEDHPFLVATRKNVANIILKDPVWKNARDLRVQGRKGDYLLIPKISPTGEFSQLDLTKYFSTSIQSRRRTEGIKNKSIELTPELAWILGLYVAEGSRVSNKDFGITFSLHENEIELRKRVRAYFSTLGYKSREIPALGKAICVQISSVILGKSFSDWCGRGAVNKRIPDFILFNSRDSIVKNFLDGYFEGDGCVASQLTVTTVSKLLALQLQLLVGRVTGMFASLRIVPAQQRLLKGSKISGEQYQATWSSGITSSKRILRNNQEIISTNHRWRDIGDYFAVPITQITSEDYDGDVCNVETENHTFLINNVISHNCDMIINQDIPNLPNDAVKLLSGWPAQEPAEVYYDKLIQQIQKKNNQGTANHRSGNNQKNGATDKGGAQNGGIPKQWDSITDAPLTNNDADSMTDSILREVIKERLNAGDSINKLRGFHAGALSSYIDELTKPPFLDWKQTITRFVTSLLDDQTRMTLKKPDRRCIAPYGRKKEYLPSLVICVDTSGSVSDGLLSEFFSQIALLGRLLSEVDVVIADAAVQDHFVYKKGLEPALKKKGHGRGGTDFDPSVRYINTNLRDRDGAIYLTDGWCPVPETKCKIPMIWVVSDNKEFEGRPRILVNSIESSG